MRVDLREFKSAYLAEVDEHLAATHALLLELDAAVRERRPLARVLREAMRLLHTIKGLSAMVGVEPVVTIAHRMESVVRATDRAGGVADERTLEALLEGTRAIEARVKAVAEDTPVAEPPAALLAELDALELDVGEANAAGPAVDLPLDAGVAEKLSASERDQLVSGAAAGRRAVRIDFAPSPDRAERGLTITSVRERLSKLGEIVRVLPLTAPASESAPGGLVFCVLLLTDAEDFAVAEAAGGKPEDVQTLVARRAPAARAELAPSASDASADDAGGGRFGVLRVDVARVDDAIEKLSALVVTRWRLQRAADALTEAGAPTRELAAILAENARQLRDLRAAILRVRMVPVATLLERLPLVVRALGKSTGKEVRLVIEGGGAEVDKTVGERLFPALVHLLRNAVDHGIEAPDDRLRAGKPAAGTLRVTSATKNRLVEVRVQDDGRGVDPEAVARKAGAAVPGDAASLLELMCRAGLSTRDHADTTSGRGMGLDIVRKVVVDGLGGELALETAPAAGTAFVVRVPLTIAIIDAFVLSCEDARYVVPVTLVEEIVELGDARTFVVRRGDAVPVVDLGAALGGPSDSARRQALVIRRGVDDRVAFAVDRVVGQQEVVLRPLLDPLVAVPGVSGSTDLGDGRATLVLDLHGLASRLDPVAERAA